MFKIIVWNGCAIDFILPKLQLVSLGLKTHSKSERLQILVETGAVNYLH